MLSETFTPQFLRQLEQLRIHSRRSYLGTRQGGHLSLRRGQGIEFADYRKYELGDDPRRIDWGLFARSDRTYVKRFREEENLSVALLLDTSASMGSNIDQAKWQSARDIALAFGYTALVDQDDVIFSALGSSISPTFRGAKSFPLMAKIASEISPQGAPDLERACRLAASRIRIPGKAVLISDLLFSPNLLRTMLNILRAKNLDVAVVQVLGGKDIDPMQVDDSARVTDSETGEELDLVFDEETRADYSELLQQHLIQLQQVCEASEVPFACKKPDQKVSDFMLSNLIQLRILR